MTAAELISRIEDTGAWLVPSVGPMGTVRILCSRSIAPELREQVDRLRPGVILLLLARAADRGPDAYQDRVEAAAASLGAYVGRVAASGCPPADGWLSRLDAIARDYIATGDAGPLASALSDL